MLYELNNRRMRNEFAEKDKGTLEPGKWADLAVLSQDIFKVPAPDLPKTKSILTMVGARSCTANPLLEKSAPPGESIDGRRRRLATEFALLNAAVTSTRVSHWKFPMRHYLILGAVTAFALCSGTAQADDTIGLYAGAGVGQASVQASDSHFSGDSFKENHSAFKVMVGVKPLPFVGGEFEYIHFGHPNGNLDNQPADVNLRGAAGFAMFYLPIPVVSLYGKIGLARMQSTLHETNNGDLFRFDRTNTDIAGGVGLQGKFGPLAIRAEGEVFNAAGAHPRLLSLGATWTFL